MSLSRFALPAARPTAARPTAARPTVAGPTAARPTAARPTAAALPVAGLLALVLLAGCTSDVRAIPTPTPATSTSRSAPTALSSTATTGTTTAPTDDPALDVCDDTGILPCQRQVVQLTLPVAGADLALNYSSDRAAGRTVDRAPSADPIGLAGWTLSVLDSYDPAGHTVITGAGARRTVTGVPAGTTTLVAAADGQTVDVFDATGRQTARMAADSGAALLTFGWGDSGLTSVSGPSGVALTVQRLPDGTPVGLVATDGATTRLGTVAGRLAAVVYPDGSRASVGVAPTGLVTAVATAAGRLTEFDYDSAGRLNRRTDGAGGIVRSSREITTTSPTGKSATTTTTLPTGGEVTDTVTVDGSSTRFRHTDAAGLATTVTRTGNQRTVTGPDGRTTTITQGPDPRWGTDAPLPATVAAGSRTLTATATGTGGQPIARTFTVDGQSWSYRYDPATRTATRTSPGGSTTTVGYDQRGRVQRSTVGGTLPVAYSYGAHDRLSAVTVGAGADARTWTYAYPGHAIVVTDPVGGVQRRDLTATGAPTAVAGPGQTGQVLARDSADRITGFAAPGAASTTVTWSANGRIAAINAPASGAPGASPQFTGFDYDATGALIKRFTADSAVTITRDAAGRATTVDPGTGAVAIGYDSSGRPTTLAGPTARVEETWSAGAVTGEKVSADKLPDGAVTTQINRTLTPTGRTGALSVAGGSTVDYGYDAAGRVTRAGDLTLAVDPASGQVSRRQLGTLTDTLSRNQFGELTSEVVTKAGTAVASVAYTRDRLGRVTGSSTQVAGSSPTVIAHSYDSSGRLDTDTVDGVVRRYSYDQAGNLTGITGPAGSTTLTYDRRNALTAAGGTTYSYDGGGRRVGATTAGTTTSYAYDGLGRLLGVKSPGAGDISYTVDGFGRRIATAGTGTGTGTATSVLAYQDGRRPIARLAGDGSVDQQYVYTDGDPLPAYLRAGGHDYLEIADASGGPGLVLDAAQGTVVDRTVRTGFGQVVSEQSPGFQPIGFAGGLVDATTGLVHFGAREYDPATAGWTAPDPLSIGGGSANLYQYVGGDPVNRRDVTGAICDYAYVGVSFGLELGPFGFTVSGGLGTAGTQLGAYGTAAGSVGAGGGLSVTGGCDDATEGHDPNQLDTFGGLGQSDSAQIFIGESHDVGFDDHGNVSSVGDSASLGFGLGLASSASKTGFLCIFGCPDAPPGNGSSDKPEPDQPGGDDCSGGGQCTPSPSDPTGDGDNPGDNVCAGGGCDDPGGNSDSSGGPDSPAGSGGRTTGDPHLRTADNTAYDFQAVGEFTWLTSDSGDLTIQVRQQPFSRSRTVSMNTAVAVGVAGDTLMVVPSPAGLVVTGPTLPGAGSFTLPHGTAGVRSATGLLLTLADGSRIWVRQNPYGLDVNIAPAAARHGHLHGLAGPFTGAPNSGVQTRSGRTLTPEQLRDRTTLYRTFGDSWRVDQQTSLFTDRPGRDATAFDDPTFPDPQASPPPAATTAAAQQVCAQLGLTDTALADCVLDVATTGDARFASAMAEATGSRPGAAAPAAGPVTGDLVPGATAAGTLSANGRKAYAFSVPAGAVGYFSADPACRAGTDLRWQVQDPSGSAMTGFSAICDDLGRVRFPAAGRYQLVVAGFDGGSGAYRFTWTASRPDASTMFSPDTTLSGTIDRPGAFDYLSMPVTAGTVVYLQAAPDCAPPGAGAKGVLRWVLLDPSGSSVTGQSAVCDDLGRVRIDQTGTYRLAIESVDGGTGPYAVRWVASRPDRSQPLAAGATAGGTIDKPGAADDFALTVTAGTVGYFAAATGCVPPAGSGSIRWQLTDPSGTGLTGMNEICDDIGRFRFPAAGTYHLHVTSADGGTGGYSVTWQQSRPDTARPLSIGTQVSGSIDRPGAQDDWSFTVGAASTVALHPAAGCTGSALRYAIQDSGGTGRSGTSPVCDGIDDVVLPAGSYRVVVSGDAAATGSYTFTATAR